jgi:hypothetical protein
VIPDPTLGRSSEAPPDDEGPIGIFPDWGWVYGTVIVYGVVVIGILTVLTRILSFGGSP